MRVAVSAAKAQLTDLLRRAEAGEDVTLTRRGEDVARIVPVARAATPAARLAAIDRAVAMASPAPGPTAARSQDFLYGDDGLPA
ncbi:MAG TPA: type II toxin-antitoxin system prevent-host-death family antitoxin [Steroidobacteraceae bacterium]